MIFLLRPLEVFLLNFRRKTFQPLMGEITNPFKITRVNTPFSRGVFLLFSYIQQNNQPPPWGRKHLLKMKLLKNIFCFDFKKNFFLKSKSFIFIGCFLPHEVGAFSAEIQQKKGKMSPITRQGVHFPLSGD